MFYLWHSNNLTKRVHEGASRLVHENQNGSTKLKIEILDSSKESSRFGFSLNIYNLKKIQKHFLRKKEKRNTIN